jgi:hypothetical protein
MRYLSELVEAQRSELQQYGEMLALFDDQEAEESRGCSEGAWLQAELLGEQKEIIELAVHKREDAQRKLGSYLCLPEDVCLTAIIRLLPQQHRLLVAALMEENHALSARVGRRAEQQRLFSKRVPMVQRQFGVPLTLRGDELPATEDFSLPVTTESTSAVRILATV